MNWVEVLALMAAVFVANMGVIIPLFLWTRSEANSDRREIANKFEKMQEEARSEFKEFRKMWATESKEFHSRLCEIEGRIRK